MKTFVVTLTILTLAVSSSILTAQEAEQKAEEQSVQMPMIQGMMGGRQGGMMQGGMMGQMPMMQRMMGKQGGMMGQMCAQMMQGGMMGGMMGQMRKMPTPQMLLSLADELKLDKDQVKSIREIRSAHQKEVIRKNADRSIAELELNALLRQDEIDLEQAREKIQQIASLEGELKIAQIKASIDAKEVLTDEQRAKLKELIMIRKAAMYIPQKGAIQKEKKAGRESMHQTTGLQTQLQ